GLRLRLRRDRARGGRLDVREADRRLRGRPRAPPVLPRREPVGAAQHHRAPARSRRPGPVGCFGAGPGDAAVGVARCRGVGGAPGSTTFPFSAVVGADDAKLALMLTAADPRIGGVLLRGDKGSAKSTLARGMAALLPGGAPFIELPLGASEE